MQHENPRSQRVADQIQRELASLLQREVKDPRIGMVTITAVNVTRELDHANVYFTVLSPKPLADEQASSQQTNIQDQTQAGLEKASGFLRRELSRRLKLRVTPMLHFIFDKSMTEGNRLANLIEMANQDVNAEAASSVSLDDASHSLDDASHRGRGE